MQTTLVTALYKDDLLNSLLQENEQLVKVSSHHLLNLMTDSQARAKCKEAQQLLSKAQVILTEVREFAIQ